jgi:hypothetical protein
MWVVRLGNSHGCLLAKGIGLRCSRMCQFEGAMTVRSRDRWRSHPRLVDVAPTRSGVSTLVVARASGTHASSSSPPEHAMSHNSWGSVRREDTGVF